MGYSYRTLIPNLLEMEHLGTVHVRRVSILYCLFLLIYAYHQTINVAPTEILNAHFPPDLPSDKIQTYTGHKWLPPACFDMLSPQHPHLALTVLMNWLQGPNCFQHIPSGTWQGGPNGAWWIVTVVAHIHKTFTMIQLNNNIPEKIEQVIDVLDFCCSQTLF
jgi:hypothetical protein